MRTLVVDGLRTLGPRTAMGRYVEHLAEEWSAGDLPFDRVVVASPADPRLDGAAAPSRVSVRCFGARLPRAAWQQLALPAWTRGASLLYCPAYTAPVAGPGRLVVGNHGIYESLPDEFPRWQRLRSTPLHRAAARRARRVIANSSATKADLVRFFGVDPQRVDVILPAAHDAFFARHERTEIEAEARAALGTPAPYVLFVGKLARRRNVPALIEAFGDVVRRRALPHHLLIVGPNTSDVAVESLATRHGVAERVHHRPHLETAPLARLYAGADVFALPTTYEGISWTMLEAMASGTAVLTVEHPQLAEGGGDAVASVPSPSPVDVARGLELLLTRPDVRRRFAAAGRARAAGHRWADVARATAEILDREAAPSDHPRFARRAEAGRARLRVPDPGDAVREVP